MNSLDVHAMELPQVGPKTIPQTLDFTTNAEITVDFTDIIFKRQIDFISGVYFNNDSTLNLTLICNGTNQIVNIAAGFQGYVTLLIADPATVTINADNTGEIVKCWFYNFPQFPVEIPRSINSGGGVTFTEKEVELSGSTLVFDGDPLPTEKLIISNPAGNADITLNLAGNDATVSGFTIAAGQSFILDGGLANDITIAGTDTELVSVFGGS